MIADRDRGVVVDLVPTPELAVLGAAWRELEARSAASVFVSWAWIGAWLAHVPPHIRRRSLLGCARDRGRIIGLWILCRRPPRHAVSALRTLVLHATGVHELDELTIEHNSLLAEQGREDEVAAAFFAAMARRRGWERLVVDGARALDPLSRHAAGGLRRVVTGSRPAPYVDLAALRRRGDLHVDGLDAQVRSRVRRSLRELTKLGPVTVHAATTADEVQAYWTGLRALHQRSWTGRGAAGSFANATFTAMHEALSRTSAAQLLRIAAGDHVVGYLYNLVHRGRIYQYQSGFDLDPARGNAWRPGLVCHSLAIDHNAAAGHDTYDFLAGDHRYKRELADATLTMRWLEFERPSARLALGKLAARAARATRSALARRRGAA